MEKPGVARVRESVKGKLVEDVVPIMMKVDVRAHAKVSAVNRSTRCAFAVAESCSREPMLVSKVTSLPFL